MTSYIPRTLTMAITSAPNTHALCGVFGDLHSRGARITRLAWTTELDGRQASISVQVLTDERRHGHLGAAGGRSS